MTRQTPDCSRAASCSPDRRAQSELLVPTGAASVTAGESKSCGILRTKRKGSVHYIQTKLGFDLRSCTRARYHVVLKLGFSGHHQKLPHAP